MINLLDDVKSPGTGFLLCLVPDCFNNHLDLLPNSHRPRAQCLFESVDPKNPEIQN